MKAKRINPLPQLKQLSLEHTATFKAIAEGVLSRTITSEGYMDLTVEMVGRLEIGALTTLEYSFCHYGEQNGDQMRDPEMVFSVIVAPGNDWHVYPHYYRNDYAFGYETESLVMREKGLMVCRRMQADQASFARDWMNNLKAQGFLEEAGKQPVERKLKREEAGA